LAYTQRRRKALATVPLSEEASQAASSTRFRLFSLGLVVAYSAIFVRCVYRIAEMAGGWKNPIQQSEPLFIALESCMVSLATLMQTSFHPGFCFPRLSNTVWTTKEKERVVGQEQGASGEQKAVGSDMSSDPSASVEKD